MYRRLLSFTNDLHLAKNGFGKMFPNQDSSAIVLGLQLNLHICKNAKLFAASKQTDSQSQIS